MTDSRMHRRAFRPEQGVDVVYLDIKEIPSEEDIKELIRTKRETLLVTLNDIRNRDPGPSGRPA